MRDNCMEYRTLPHGGEKISVIGLGSGSLTGTEQEMTAVIDAAIITHAAFYAGWPTAWAVFNMAGMDRVRTAMTDFG